MTIDQQSIGKDLVTLGIGKGDVLLVHASFKAIGCLCISPQDVIACLLQCIGDEGTLLMPALSYKQEPRHVHDNRTTPSNVGVMAEVFRTQFNAIRSLHPTHSVCALGQLAEELSADHHLDRTPCGVHSPFRKLLFMDAKILMLGCGLRSNTSMHAVEEIIGTPYLFGDERDYTIVDGKGNVQHARYRDHGFEGWAQRYDRIAGMLGPGDCVSGNLGKAMSYVMQTKPMLNAGLAALKRDRFAFVSPRAATTGSQSHS